MISAMQIKHLNSLSSLLLSVDKIAFETEKEKRRKKTLKPKPWVLYLKSAILDSIR